MYSIRVLPSALKALKPLPKKTRLRILAAIDALANDPRPPGTKKLQGGGGLHRIRVGNYRIIYLIEGDEVIVARTGDRKEVYKKLWQLLLVLFPAES